MGDELVECHSGYTYAQRPVALVWQGIRLKIDAVMAEWQVPQGRRFLVMTQNQQQFELIYQESGDFWRVYPV